MLLGFKMSLKSANEILKNGLIDEDQYEKIEPIASGRIISVFYELRTVLYLGVMLFTSGIGILIYQNIGDLGHLISIGILTVSTAASFWYVNRNQQPYSHARVGPPTPYFDYILLLGALLLVSVQGYLQVQYFIFYNFLGLSTLLNALIFFYFAYRHDHRGILSLGITAFASFWGLTLSSQKWYSPEFFENANLDVTAILFGIFLAGGGLLLYKRGIKEHFTFTYINFASLIFFSGTTSALFVRDSQWWLFVPLIYAGCVGCFFYAKMARSFLFLLYLFIFGYIATTYLLVISFLEDIPILWSYYSLISCGGFAYFIIKYRQYFNRKE